MVSTFTWLDFSESERQQAMQVLDLFREQSTLDELGFAPIRDAFADHFFPGTSTIQTRARYFLFVPWIIARSEKPGIQSDGFLNRVRYNETKLIKALLEGDPHQSGIIGREAKGTLKRMPSAVYWRGLHLWGIRLFDGSIDQFAREREYQRQQERKSLVTDDGEPVQHYPSLWCPDLPPAPEGLLDSVTFQLTEDESKFLATRICSKQPHSALAQILMAAKGPIDSNSIWDTQLQAIFTAKTSKAIEFARRFAGCAWGGSLVYTRMVALLKGGCDELVEAIDQKLQDWQQHLELEASVLHQWDLDDFWSLIRQLNPRLTEQTRQFADAWIEVSRKVADGNPAWKEPDVTELIRRREVRLKGYRARLRPENLRARDRWQGSVTSGPMDYRWSQSRTVLNDILTPSSDN
jgi:hypothetical protein